MLANFLAWVGVKNPKYNWRQYVEDATFTHRLSGEQWRLRVRLPVYTPEAKSFWYELMKGRNTFKLKGFSHKWVITQLTEREVCLEKVVMLPLPREILSK